MTERHFSRRRILALGGGAAVTGVAGVATAMYARSDDDIVGNPGYTSTGAYRSPELVADLPDGFTRIENAFEGREFAPGEVIDWEEGIFFLQQDGRVEGLRAKTTLASQWPIPPGTSPNSGWWPSPWDDPAYVAPLASYESLCDGEIIRAEVWHHRDRSRRYVYLHRNSGTAFTIDEKNLMLWPVGPLLMLVSTAHLNYDDPLKRIDGHIPLEYELLDGGLRRLRTGTILTSSQRGRSSENSLAYDRASDQVYYFEPADDWKRLVRAPARGKAKPTEVLQEKEMAEARTVSGTTSNWDLDRAPDGITIVGVDQTTQSAWLMRDGRPVVRGRGLEADWGYPQLSPDGAYLAELSLLAVSCLVIRDARTMEPALRVRGATAGLGLQRWTHDGRLVIDVMGAPSSVLTFDRTSASLDRIAPSLHRGHGRVPSPSMPGLVATGILGFELADGTPVEAAIAPAILAKLDADETLDLINPWSARPHEWPFTYPALPFHRSSRPSVELPPVVEFAPYNDDLVLTTTAAYDLRDGAVEVGAVVGRVGLGERVTLVPNPREEWPKATIASWAQLPGTYWAHISTPSGAYGWMPVEHLRWAVGTPI